MASRKPAITIDPAAARAAMIRAISGADAPTPVKVLQSLPELARKLTAKEVHAWLGDMPAAPTSDGPARWGSAYWDQDAASVARERVLVISAAQVLPAAALKKLASAGSPKVSSSLIGKAVAELIAGKKLLRERSGLVNAAHPEVYVAEQIGALLSRFGLCSDQAPISALLKTETSSVRDVSEKLLAAVNRIASSPGTTVTFYRLRQQPELADVPKKVFDEAALLLQNERKALLSVHDHAPALSEEERDRFVTDGLGRYYVSIYAR